MDATKRRRRLLEGLFRGRKVPILRRVAVRGEPAPPCEPGPGHHAAPHDALLPDQPGTVGGSVDPLLERRLREELVAEVAVNLREVPALASGAQVALLSGRAGRTLARRTLGERRGWTRPPRLEFPAPLLRLGRARARLADYEHVVVTRPTFCRVLVVVILVILVTILDQCAIRVVAGPVELHRPVSLQGTGRHRGKETVPDCLRNGDALRPGKKPPVLARDGGRGAEYDRRITLTRFPQPPPVQPRL